MSKDRKHHFLAILGQGTTQGFALLSLLILLRLISVEAYGIWAMYLAILSVAEMARAGFVQNGMVSFMQAEPDQDKRIIGSAYLLNIGLGILLWGVVALICMPLSVWWSAPQLTELGLWYGLFMVCLGGLRFLEYVQIARREFGGVVIGNVVYGGGQTAVLLGMILTGYKPMLVQLLWLQALMAALGAATVWVLKRKLFTFGKPSLDWIKQLADYGRFVLGTNVGSMLLQRVDTFMIGFFLGPVALAPYNVAMRLTNYLEVPLRGLSTSTFPKVGRVWKKEGKNASARLHDWTIAQMLALTIPVCVVMAAGAEWLVWLMAGDGYEESVMLLRVLLLFALIKPWGRMFGTTLDAIGYPRLNFRLVWLGLAVNVLCNLLLIPLMGAGGAAWATVGAMFLMAIVNQYKIQPFMPAQSMRVVKNIGKVYRRGWDWLLAKALSARSSSAL